MVSISKKRRSRIIEELNRKQTVRVSELSERLGVSQVSIRRDLQHLEEMGLLKRVHGGAVRRLGTRPGSNQTMAQIEKKARIGRAGAQLIQPTERIIFDSGTTPLQVARSIDNDLLTGGNLTIISAYLPLIREMGPRKSLHTIVLGGIYLPAYEVMAGPQTIEQLKGLHADKMFLGTDGMTLSHGLTTANLLEAQVDRAMAQASTQVIVVSDSSKIGVIGLATIMPLKEIDKLITDQDAPQEFVDTLTEYGVQVILV
ncbi:MAG: DeoR/GlpR family DNA-binding transcription regulator [Anaerolineales bacterium]|jgi:DeoR family fructose operon transcriptional repressor